MQGLAIGHGKEVKAVYSNGVTTAFSDALRDFLVEKLAFQAVEKKKSASLHLMDSVVSQSHNIAFVVSTGAADAGKLTVRKIKTQTRKLQYLTDLRV